MPGIVKFSPEEFNAAAIKYRQELLMLPIIGCEATLQFMNARPGIRGKEAVGKGSVEAQFAPYKSSRESDANLEIVYRELETFLGSVVAKFEPNSAAGTILGLGATKGSGQASTPTAIEVLRLIAASLSEHLNDAIWKAKRNPSGDTTLDLFDGFDTITEAEISAGTIAAEKRNFLQLDKAIDESNAYELIKKIMRSMHPTLRAQECYMYCSQDIYDAYLDSYLITHGATPYNTEFEKLYVEGSNKKLILCPLDNKEGSKYIHVSPKSNMLYGFDNMGDVESVEVARFAPFILDYIATMFFGVQFETIDPRRLFVAQLAS